MLERFMSQSLAEPFEWGRNDCALWAASAFEQVTGFDPAKDLRGTYQTAFQCRRIVIENGGMIALCRKLMKPAPARSYACEGIGVFRIDGMAMAGVVVNNRLHVRTETGVRIDDTFDMLVGWSW